ncbi:MAG: Ig-like domain-containing protein [Eubacteriales bacterium]|nr:Ig-like domain-containing protein [Eubacteriales bacterium]
MAGKSYCGHTNTKTVKENEKAAACETAGSYEEVVYCSDCGEEISRTLKSISAKGHTAVSVAGKAATCTATGLTAGSKCKVCGKVLTAQQVILAKGHTPVSVAGKAATCTATGLTAGSKCSVCGQVLTAQSSIAAAHTWGAWKTTTNATVFSPAKQTAVCKVCGAKKTRNYGSKLTARISLTASSLTMRTKQKTTAFKVTFANGDAVKSWKSSNTKIVKVTGKANGSCTITAQKKTGTAKITITLKSGKKAVLTVKVQKKAVATKSIKLSSTKVTLKKGKSVTLKPIVSPITSQDKVKYTTSNKKIATVNSKGVVKGIKPGKVKIKVKSGKKTVTCTVVVVK